MVSKYTTQDGDMWDSIALSQLGDSYYANQLIDANRKYSAVVIFEAGIQLTVPTIVTELSKVNVAPWKRRNG